MWEYLSVLVWVVRSRIAAIFCVVTNTSLSKSYFELGQFELGQSIERCLGQSHLENFIKPKLQNRISFLLG